MEILTVSQYNELMNGRNSMKVRTKTGELAKRGFMIAFNGEYIFTKTKKEALKVSESDFNIKSPVHSNNGCGISNDSYINA